MRVLYVQWCGNLRSYTLSAVAEPWTRSIAPTFSDSSSLFSKLWQIPTLYHVTWCSPWYRREAENSSAARPYRLSPIITRPTSNGRSRALRKEEWREIKSVRREQGLLPPLIKLDSFRRLAPLAELTCSRESRCLGRAPCLCADRSAALQGRRELPQ